MAVYAGQYGPNGLEFPDGGRAVMQPIQILDLDSEPAVLYLDRNRSGLADNPVMTDEYGNLLFYADPGFYRISTSAGVSDIIPVYPDPFEVTAGSETAASITVSRTTSGALSGHRLVVPMDNGQVEYADATVLDHHEKPVWLTTGAWGPGVNANLLAIGEVEEPSWTWSPDSPIWLGANGALTQTIPLGAMFIRKVAEVISPTAIYFAPQQPIVVS